MLFKSLLFIHIFSLIVTLGPSFAFLVLGEMSGNEPLHSIFALNAMSAIDRRFVTPAGFVLGLSGLGLLLSAGFGLTHFWLDAGIILYIALLGVVHGFQRPTSRKLLQTVKAIFEENRGDLMPEMMGLVKKTRRGGSIIALIAVTVMVLMIFKPGG